MIRKLLPLIVVTMASVSVSQAEAAPTPLELAKTAQAKAVVAETAANQALVDANEAVTAANAVVQALETEPPPPPPKATYEGFSASNPPPASWRPGSESSPFNTPVKEPQVLPNSAAMVSYVLGLGSPAPGSLLTGGEWDHPTYFASNEDPFVQLVGPGVGRTVRVPAQAVPAPGDKHMEIVIAPAEAQVPGETFNMWDAERSAGKITYAYGGVGNLQGSLIEAGIATAAGFDLSAGVIRADELAAGVINHALFCVVKANRAGFVYPANHSDGTTQNTNAPYEGQRFILGYTIPELEALKLPPWKFAIARALAVYGCYVGDSGGPGFGFQFESSAMYTAFGLPDPFVAIAQANKLLTWEGKYVFNLASGINWSRLLAIQGPLP